MKKYFGIKNQEIHKTKKGEKILALDFFFQFVTETRF